MIIKDKPMKKTIAILAILAVSFISVNAYAQKQEKDNYLFNHWSVGVGFLEDFHVQVAGTILPNLQVRVIYNTLHPYLAIANGILKNNPNVGAIDPFVKSIPMNINQNGIKIDNLDLSARFASRELEFLVDFFPGKSSSFHFTGGIIVDVSPRMLDATATPNPALPAGDRATKEVFGISTDPNGVVHMYAAYGLKVVRPYLGIGFGRPVDLKKRVGVSVDMGLAYIGGLHLYSQTYIDDPTIPNDGPDNPVEVELNEAWMNKYPDIKNNLGADAAQYISILNTVNSFPVLPYIRFAINVRLF